MMCQFSRVNMHFETSTVIMIVHILSANLRSTVTSEVNCDLGGHLTSKVAMILIVKDSENVD